MDKIWEFNNSIKPNIEELEIIGKLLLNELSKFLETDLKAFKEYIVTGESNVISFYAIYNSIKLFSFQIEGVLMYSINNNKEPSINAEILLFSLGDRLGLQRDTGDSYLTLKYTKEFGWVEGNWIADGCAEWENYKKPRINLYSNYEKTIEKL